MNIRNWGPTATREFLSACAVAADNSTLDAIWFNAHLGLPPRTAGNDNGLPLEASSIIEPLGFAHYLAACTKRIAVGTAVLVLPYRPKILTAKLLASIRILSGDRFLHGIGLGYLAEEFRVLGVDHSRRGRDTDATIDFLRHCATSDVIEENGQAFLLRPKLSCPPIYIGGGASIAIPCAVRCGDGWIPACMLAEDLAPHVAELNQQVADAGRESQEVVAMKTLPLEDLSAAIDMAGAYRDAGATHLVHTQGYDSPSHYAEIIEQVDGHIRQAL